MVGPSGIEPETFRLSIECSIPIELRPYIKYYYITTRYPPGVTVSCDQIYQPKPCPCVVKKAPYSIASYRITCQFRLSVAHCIAARGGTGECNKLVDVAGVEPACLITFRLVSTSLVLIVRLIPLIRDIRILE